MSTQLSGKVPPPPSPPVPCVMSGQNKSLVFALAGGPLPPPNSGERGGALRFQFVLRAWAASRF